MQSSPVSLGDLLLIVTVICSSGAAVWRISSLVSGLNTRLEDLEKDKFGMSQVCELALRQSIANPGMRVPDPRHPGEIIQVLGDGDSNNPNRGAKK